MLDAAGHGRQGLMRGVAGNDDEFVAPEAAGVVEALAQDGAQDLAQITQGLVAGVVAVGVVELLEFVDVEKDEAQGHGRAPRARDLPFQDGLEMVAVEDLGQGVEQGLFLDLAFQSADGGDAPTHDQGVIRSRGQSGEEQFQLQVLVVEHDLGLHGLGAVLQVFHAPRSGKKGGRARDLEQVLAPQEGRVPTRGIGDGPGRVRGHDQILHGLKQEIQKVALA